MPYKDEEKRIEHSRAYYLKNRDKIIADVSARYKENPNVVKERNKKRFENNHELILSQMKEYRELNKDKVKEAIKNWLAIPENKDKIKKYKSEWDKEWRKTHKGEKNSNTAKRYARKLNGLKEDSDLNKIKDFFLLAERLTILTGIRYSVDHIKPLILGGLHHQDNLQVITLSDNILKGKKYPFEIENKFFPSNDFITHV